MSELIDKAKGRIKQAFGSITGDKGLKQEGESDERKGQVEGAVKDVKHAVKGAVKDVKHAIKEVSK
ncbi:MAG: CsbD family protein [Opitutaceae bacterium]